MALYKCVLLVRSDLKMTKGKVIAQCGHGIVSMMNEAKQNKIQQWMECGEKIVTLKIPSIDSMRNIHSISTRKKVYSHIVQDAGRTQVEAGTETVCIIGPEKEEIIDKWTHGLKLY
jgi:PTH2 family peptidyl-tRNA hydrolase